jgi:hypothetical protein
MFGAVVDSVIHAGIEELDYQFRGSEDAIPIHEEPP